MPNEMFSAAEFFELEHTAHSKLFEADKYVWEALKQIPSYLQFRLKPAVLGELVGKPFVSGSVFIGSGTIVEQGAMLKGPAWIGRIAPFAAAVTCAKTSLSETTWSWEIRASSKTASFSTRRRSRISAMSATRSSATRAHLGAGVILSNVKLDHAEISVLATDGMIATGLRKFGAIIGDRSEIGCNAVFNPGSVIGRDCIVYPGTNFRGVLPGNSIIKVRQTTQVLSRRQPNDA